MGWLRRVYRRKVRRALGALGGLPRSAAPRPTAHTGAPSVEPHEISSLTILRHGVGAAEMQRHFRAASGIALSTTRIPGDPARVAFARLRSVVDSALAGEAAPRDLPGREAEEGREGREVVDAQARSSECRKAICPVDGVPCGDTCYYCNAR